MKALSRWLYNRLDFFSEMFLTKPIPFVRNSNPMLSDSSIRRLKRQRIIPQRCRNQDAGLSGPMSRARLALRGRHRFPIGFSFLKHPEACLREVAGNSHFGFAMAPPWLDPLVKPADMIVATTLAIKDRAVSRLNKGPLQIHIDIAGHRSKANLPAAGVLPRHQPAVTRQLLGPAVPLNVADLGPHHERKAIAFHMESLEPVGLERGITNTGHLCIDPYDIT